MSNPSNTSEVGGLDMRRLRSFLESAILLADPDETIEPEQFEALIDSCAEAVRQFLTPPQPTEVSVKCAYPPCTNRLRDSGSGARQWCSKDHRSSTLAPEHFDDSGAVADGID